MLLPVTKTYNYITAHTIDEIWGQLMSLHDASNLNLLILEDDEDILHLVKESVSVNFNFNSIHTGINGIAGINILNNHQVDLVISDISMPKMNGVEFLKEVKDLGMDHLVTVMLTGNATTEYAINSLRYGAFDFLHKPLDSSFVDVINSAIDHLNKSKLSIEDRLKASTNLTQSLIENFSLLEHIEEGVFTKTNLSCLYRNLAKSKLCLLEAQQRLQQSLIMIHQIRINQETPSPQQLTKLRENQHSLMSILNIKT